MMRPGRGVADRPRLRVVSNEPMPAFVPDRHPAPLTGPRLVLCWGAMVAGGWFMTVGIAWTAYAVCRMTGVCR